MYFLFDNYLDQCDWKPEYIAFPECQFVEENITGM